MTMWSLSTGLLKSKTVHFAELYRTVHIAELCRIVPIEELCELCILQNCGCMRVYPLLPLEVEGCLSRVLSIVRKEPTKTSADVDTKGEPRKFAVAERILAG